MIVQNISLVGTPNLSITVPRRDVERAAAAVASVVGPDGSCTEPAIAKLSVVGVGMRSHTGVAAHMFQRLGRAGDRHLHGQYQRGLDQRGHRVSARA